MRPRNHSGNAHHDEGSDGGYQQRNWNQQQEGQPDPERNGKNAVTHDDGGQVLLHFMRAHVVGEVFGLAERAPADEPEMAVVAVGHAHHQQRQLLAVDGEFAGALLVGFQLRIVEQFGIVGDRAEPAHVGVVEQHLEVIDDTGRVDLGFLPRELEIFGGVPGVAALRSIDKAGEGAARVVAPQRVGVFCGRRSRRWRPEESALKTVWASSGAHSRLSSNRWRRHALRIRIVFQGTSLPGSEASGGAERRANNDVRIRQSFGKRIVANWSIVAQSCATINQVGTGASERIDGKINRWSGDGSKTRQSF